MEECPQGHTAVEHVIYMFASKSRKFAFRNEVNLESGKPFSFDICSLFTQSWSTDILLHALVCLCSAFGWALTLFQALAWGLDALLGLWGDGKPGAGRGLVGTSGRDQEHTQFSTDRTRAWMKQPELGVNKSGWNAEKFWWKRSNDSLFMNHTNIFQLL